MKTKFTINIIETPSNTFQFRAYVPVTGEKIKIHDFYIDVETAENLKNTIEQKLKEIKNA